MGGKVEIRGAKGAPPLPLEGVRGGGFAGVGKVIREGGEEGGQGLGLRGGAAVAVVFFYACKKEGENR